MTNSICKHCGEIIEPFEAKSGYGVGQIVLTKGWHHVEASTKCGCGLYHDDCEDESGNTAEPIAIRWRDGSR